MAVVLPDWAGTLLDVIGVDRPNVDEDAYRDLADALRDSPTTSTMTPTWRICMCGDCCRPVTGRRWTRPPPRSPRWMKASALVQLGILAEETGVALSLIPVTGGLSMLLGAGAVRITQEAVKRLIKGAMRG
ncbi:hypothetical protein M1P56_23055 [Streptomyces sp. HU2014]|nr:hypothetical protein [Streptomyces sp. HU2014]UQI47017.1 hypothetical protein M1P56_23055 [Streptomyces sp. HU2014]